MADEPNDNGRRSWLTKDTFVPWGAVIAVAVLVWWHASKMMDLERAFQSNAAALAEKVADQRRETSLELQALKYSVENLSQRVGRVEASVDNLTLGEKR